MRAGTYPLTAPAVRTGLQLSAILLLLGSAVVLVVAVWQIGDNPQGRGNWPLAVTIACLAWLAVYVACAYVHFHTLYLFSAFYIAALILFHLSAPAADAFGWYPGIATAPDIAPRWLELSGWYSVVALASFGLGQGVAFRARVPAKKRVSVASLPFRGLLFRDAVGLLAVSCALLAWVFLTVGNLLSFSRAELFRGVGDTRGLGVFLMLFPSAVVLFFFSASSGIGKALGIFLAVCGFALIMLSGYRTSALYPLVVGAILWRKTGRRIPMAVAAAALVVLVAAISFVGVLRQSGPYSAMSQSTMNEALQHVSTRDTLHLGQTGALLAHVLRLVPHEDGYRYGMTYLEGLRQAIPNVSSQISESPRQAVKRGVFTRATFERLVPSDWLTYRIAPWAFDIGQGVGFTAIGEAYLNFGTLGVPAIFGLLGFLLGRLDHVDLSRHAGWFIFCGAFAWHLIRTVRDDFTNFTKPAAFTLLALIAWRVATYLVGWRVARPKP